MAGRLWFELCGLHVDYRAEYVSSAENLADGPSRNDVTNLTLLGAHEVTDWICPRFADGLDGWMKQVSLCERIVLFP